MSAGTSLNVYEHKDDRALFEWLCAHTYSSADGILHAKVTPVNIQHMESYIDVVDMHGGYEASCYAESVLEAVVFLLRQLGKDLVAHPIEQPADSNVKQTELEI